MQQQTHHAAVKINLLCLGFIFLPEDCHYHIEKSKQANTAPAKMKSSLPLFLILTLFSFQELYPYLFNLKVIELLYNKTFAITGFSERGPDQTYRTAASFFICIICVIFFSMFYYVLKNIFFLIKMQLSYSHCPIIPKEIPELQFTD